MEALVNKLIDELLAPGAVENDVAAEAQTRSVGIVSEGDEVWPRTAAGVGGVLDEGGLLRGQ